MNQFTARMVHPDGPHQFPTDPTEDRDTGRDPRSVMTLANDVEQAKEILLRDNDGFVFLTGPDDITAEQG